MARYEFNESEIGTMGAAAQADILFELGMMYATGRDCDMDLIAAHKWFNLAALRGNPEAAYHRQQIAEELSDVEIAMAQRDAREWLGTH